MTKTSTTETENARITGTVLGVERGTMTYMIHLEGDGWGQGFGGYSLSGDPAFGLESIRLVISALGGHKWEDLPGRLVRVKRGQGDRIIAIGHIVEDSWYDIDQHSNRAA